MVLALLCLNQLSRMLTAPFVLFTWTAPPSPLVAVLLSKELPLLMVIAPELSDAWIAPPLPALLVLKAVSCTVRAPVESACTAPPLPPVAVLLSNELPLLMAIGPEVREA